MQLKLEIGMLIVRRKDMRVWRVVERAERGAYVESPDNALDQSFVEFSESVMTLKQVEDAFGNLKGN